LERALGNESAFSTLRGLVRRTRPAERCELCSAGLFGEHEHLLEPGTRKLMCTCEACSILFSNKGTKYKRVPRRVLSLPDFQLPDDKWDSLRVPIAMAFFFHSTPDNRVLAMYPSPAGATESLLPLEAWKEIEDDNRVLKQMSSDVEALLVDRIGHSRGAAPAEYFILPIDKCYELVGLIRGNWKGLSGGTEVWQKIGEFFQRVKERAQVVKGEAHA